MAKTTSKAAPAAARSGPVKAYNIAVDGDHAEINMYGEVVEAHPVDWWTGQPVEGSFIALDDFLRDLDDLKSKGSITIHLNSVGGSADAGLAIRNRMREMRDVTVIVDSLAASAGSMILQGASPGKRYVRNASQVMVHGVSGLLYGYYDIPALENVVKQFRSTEKAYTAAYVESGGQDEKKVMEDIAATTWLVGQEAVDAGYADAVLDFDEEGDGDSKSALALAEALPKARNGMPEFWRVGACLRAVASAKPMVQPAAAPQGEHTKNKQEDKDMEIKNVDELRAAYPDLAAQIENDARNAGAEQERARIQGIEAIEAAVGDKNMVQAAKFGDTRMTAEQLALKAMQAQAAIGVTMLGKMDADAKASGTAAVGASPNAGAEDPKEAEEAEAINMIVGTHGKKEG